MLGRIAVTVLFLGGLGAAELADEIAVAQKKGDLESVQRLARKVRARTPAELRALMVALDPKRAGAFVSAPCLAGALVLDATARNDRAFAADAAAVLAAHAGRARSGKWAKAMRDYAQALVAVEAEDDAKAAELLAGASTAMRAEDWTPLAMHAAVELAAVELRRESERGAVAAVASVADVFPAEADRSLRSVFRGLYDARLEGAPAAVREAFDAVMAPHAGGMSVRAAGGAGGAGGDGGRPAKSKVGQALPRFPRKKALMYVRRKPEGFEIRQGFDKKFQATQKRKPGTKYHADGGVTLGFFNHAVALVMVDPTGLNGQPGESSVGPAPHEAYYYLARKETWTVTKEGVVTIR